MGYKFFIRMDNSVFGPYTTKEIIELRLLDDIEVMEESLQEWHMAKQYVFNEGGCYIILEDGSIKSIPLKGIPPSASTEEPKLGWNWGAFVFGWLWGLFNGVYWPLIMLIPLVLRSFFSLSIIINVGLDLAIGAILIILGVNGSEMSWNGKKWKDAKEFNEVQHKWAMSALYVAIISFVLGLVFNF